MNRNNYQKFRLYLKSGGSFYAFSRAVKYLIFLLKDKARRLKMVPPIIIIKGKIRIVCYSGSINLFYDDEQITKSPGLSVAIKKLGNWVDSSSARWKILKSGIDFVEMKAVIPKSGIEQFWKLAIDDGSRISCQVKLRTKRLVSIEEVSFAGFLDHRYKAWFCDHLVSDFPAFSESWQDLYSGDRPVSLLGVRFPIEGAKLVSLALDPEDKDLLPFVKNSPSSGKSHIIGFTPNQFRSEVDCFPGVYRIFSGKIFLFDKDHLLDEKIEKIRDGFLGSAIKKNMHKSMPRQGRILLANLPWQRDGMWGVRAGS
ncbi:hypothetical protein EPN54_00525, partial [bacterium]